MKSKIARLVSISAMCVVLSGCGSAGEKHVSSDSPNWLAKNYGGTTTIYIAPGRKLEEITWKGDDDLWVLTRPMREGETAEEYTFEQHSNFGLMDGQVIIKESTSED